MRAYASAAWVMYWASGSAATFTTRKPKSIARSAQCARSHAAEMRLGGQIRGNVLWLSVVSLLTDLSSEMIYPLLPFFLTTLGAGAAFLGFIEGVAETT